MTKLSRYVHLDDALFVLALAIPAMFAVARYVDTAAETRASTPVQRILVSAPASPIISVPFLRRREQIR